MKSTHTRLKPWYLLTSRLCTGACGSWAHEQAQTHCACATVNRKRLPITKDSLWMLQTECDVQEKHGTLPAIASCLASYLHTGLQPASHARQHMERKKADAGTISRKRCTNMAWKDNLYRRGAHLYVGFRAQFRVQEVCDKLTAARISITLGFVRGRILLHF